jgi:hypothetical protein
MLLQNVTSTHRMAVLVCFKEQPRKKAFLSNRLLLDASVWHAILMFTEHALQYTLIETRAFSFLLSKERLLTRLREEFVSLLLSCLLLFLTQQPPVGQGILIDEVSRSQPLTTHNTHNLQTSMPPVGFEPTIPARERPLGPAHVFLRIRIFSPLHLRIRMICNQIGYFNVILP